MLWQILISEFFLTRNLFAKSKLILVHIYICLCTINVVGEWRSHFLKEHWNPGPYNSEVGSCYNYGEYCTIKFDEKDLYYTLIGPDKDLFLLVKEPILNVGYVPLLYYIDVPDRGQNVFPCELRVVTRENCCTNSVTHQSDRKSTRLNSSHAQ